MPSPRDAYTGIKTDWLGRQHIKFVRKRIREAHKRANQLNLKLDSDHERHSSRTDLERSRARTG